MKKAILLSAFAILFAKIALGQSNTFYNYPYVNLLIEKYKPDKVNSQSLYLLYSYSYDSRGRITSRERTKNDVYYHTYQTQKYQVAKQTIVHIRFQYGYWDTVTTNIYYGYADKYTLIPNSVKYFIKDKEVASINSFVFHEPFYLNLFDDYNKLMYKKMTFTMRIDGIPFLSDFDVVKNQKIFKPVTILYDNNGNVVFKPDTTLYDNNGNAVFYRKGLVYNYVGWGTSGYLLDSNYYSCKIEYDEFKRPVKIDYYYIWLHNCNDLPCPITRIDKKNYIFGYNASTEPTAIEYEVSIFPNPSKDGFIYLLSPQSENIAELPLDIYDYTGHFYGSCIATNGVIDLSLLNNGIYLLNVKTPSKDVWKKVIISKD